MRSANIDIKRLINLSLSNGAITVEEIRQAVAESRDPKTRLPMTQHCGHARDSHGNLYSFFLATDKNTGKLRKSKDGVRQRFNFQGNGKAKKQEATSLGEVLPQGAQQGVPSFSAEQVAYLESVAAKKAVQAQDQVEVPLFGGSPDDDIPF